MVARGQMVGAPDRGQSHRSCIWSCFLRLVSGNLKLRTYFRVSSFLRQECRLFGWLRLCFSLFLIAFCFLSPYLSFFLKTLFAFCVFSSDCFRIDVEEDWFGGEAIVRGAEIWLFSEQFATGWFQLLDGPWTRCDYDERAEALQVKAGFGRRCRF